MSKRKKRIQEADPKNASAQTQKSKRAGRNGVDSTPMLNWFLILLAVFPFVFSRVLMEPVLSIRYTIVSAFVLAFVIYFFAFRKLLVSVEWPTLAKTVFFLGVGYGLWNFVSLSKAVNIQHVYFGLGRHFLNMVLLFIIVQIAQQHENRLIRICKLLSVAAILHGIIGLCQFYDAGFTNIPGNFRPYGLMANRNLFGSAQVLLLPFSLFVLYRGNQLWKIVAGLSVTFILLSAIISQTRSAWLAGIAMVIVSLILVLIFSRSNRRKWIIGTTGGLGLTALLAFLLISSDTEGEFFQSIKSRTSEIFAADTTGGSSTAAGNVNERLKIWNKTIDVIKDNAITGVGMENWKITVARYGSEGLVWAKGDYIPDNPHNEYLLVAAESGLPGAVLFFGMWILVVVTGFKVIIKSVSDERKILAILMVAGIVGFAVDSMFSFPLERIEHSFYLYLMAGILVGLFLNLQATPLNKKTLHPGLWVAMIVISSFNLFIGSKKMMFEKYLLRSKTFEMDKKYQQAVDEGIKAKNNFVNIAPNGFPVEAYIGLAYKELKKVPEALKEMDAAIKIHPYNKALYINKGTVYTDMGKYEEAIKFYKLAQKLTPDMDIIYYNLGATYFEMKNYRSTVEALSKADLTGKPNLIAIKQQAEAMLAQDTTGNRQ